tara:strand:+ start:159 stop:569 length:411 start_codon:yes stop_codon:yes gene_type:complete
MAKTDKILYTAIAGKTMPLIGLMALLGVGIGTGEERMDGVGLPTWVTVAALAIGVIKVVADAWASYRKSDFETLTNRAIAAEKKAAEKTEESEKLQKKVFELEATVRLAQTQASNAGVSTEQLALRKEVEPASTDG